MIALILTYTQSKIAGIPAIISGYFISVVYAYRTALKYIRQWKEKIWACTCISVDTHLGMAVSELIGDSGCIQSSVDRVKHRSGTRDCEVGFKYGRSVGSDYADNISYSRIREQTQYMHGNVYAYVIYVPHWCMMRLQLLLQHRYQCSCVFDYIYK